MRIKRRRIKRRRLKTIRPKRINYFLYFFQILKSILRASPPTKTDANLANAQLSGVCLYLRFYPYPPFE